MRILFRSALRRPLSILILVVMDTLALLVGLVLAGYLMGGAKRVEEMLYLVPIVLTGWLVIFAAHGLFARAHTRRRPGSLLGAIVWGAGLLAVGSVIYPQSGFSLGEVFLGAFLALLLDAGLRLLYEEGIELAYRRGFASTPMLLVGEGAERMRMHRIVESSSSVHACVEGTALNSGRLDLPTLRRELDETGARRVMAAGTERLPEEELMAFVHTCRLRKVKVEVIPSAVTVLGVSSTLVQDSGVPLLEMGYPQMDNTQRALKRVLDVMLSLGGLLALSPLLLAVAVLIKLTSPGPVLFCQKRVGTDEKVFVCYKFRSMYSDSEQRQAKLEAQNEADGVLFKLRNDPRVTAVGRFIRRWSIDELPQLINVLKGEMSLVGPRPLPIRDFQRMSELHKKRLAAVPGITGYWQTSGRSKLFFTDMVRLDLYYIENWSLFLDLKIILKTLWVILRREGAF